MKKTIIVALLFIFQLSFGQKSVYTDVENLSSTLEYKAAQAELDKISLDWKTEIETNYFEVNELFKAFQKEAMSLTNEIKKERKSEIENKLKAVKDLQTKRFGINGDLYKKRLELISRLQG